MIQSYNDIFYYFVFTAIFIVLMSIIFFFATIKYKKYKVKFLAFFTTLNTRKIILIASLILNFTLIVFFAVVTSHFSHSALYMIIINSLIYMIVSLNIHIIISNIIYTIISIISLKIINLIYDYLTYIYYDRLTFVLGIIFIILLITYELFITFRQLEIILKKNGGSLKNERSKSRKLSESEQ